MNRILDRTLLVDGFNLIITIEVALSGGLVLDCADGTVRDLAGLRGSYHPVDETDGAAGDVSWRSPVGRALLGRGPDDTVTVKWHAGLRELTIVDIDYK